MTKKARKLVAEKLLGSTNIGNGEKYFDIYEIDFLNGRRIYESREVISGTNKKTGYAWTSLTKADPEFLAEDEKWLFNTSTFEFDDERELRLKTNFKNKIINIIEELKPEITINFCRCVIDNYMMKNELEIFLNDYNFYEVEVYEYSINEEVISSNPDEIECFLTKNPQEIAELIAKRCIFKAKYSPMRYESKKEFVTDVGWWGSAGLLFKQDLSEMYDELHQVDSGKFNYFYDLI
ncbi:hypothetical protein CDP41_14045 [Listeria monocytogenes]|nr:hypothetical protein [Listeria monocytogenes]EAW7173849.1 hypothetical protein [Listeria monocytogenes]EDO0936254.1 hypothetical protein [Listeria monocytogenes]MDC69943.1 hypothetical protein [Listeria monocytogenes]